MGQGQRVGSCSSHTSTRSSSGFSSTRATCQGVGIPKIVSNSLVSCIRSSAGAFYQQDTSSAIRRRASPHPPGGPRRRPDESPGILATHGDPGRTHDELLSEGDAGWKVNDKRVERIWRREGLKVTGKQPKRGHLWLNDGSFVRLRAERADHVWSYDFVHHRTHDGRAFPTLNILDEFTRESLAIRVRRKLSSVDVIDVLTGLFILRGIPAYIRSDNGLPQKSRRQSFSDLTIGSVDSAARRQAGSTLAESHADHSHTGSRPRPACPHEALTERRTPGGRSKHYLRGRMRLDGPWAKGSSRLVSSLPGSGRW